MSNGTILSETLAAADLLLEDLSVAADVERAAIARLRRDGQETERWNHRSRLDAARQGFVGEAGRCAGPVIAATDYIEKPWPNGSARSSRKTPLPALERRQSPGNSGRARRCGRSSGGAAPYHCPGLALVPSGRAHCRPGGRSDLGAVGLDPGGVGGLALKSCQARPAPAMQTPA